jgi:hypothetical protein
MVATCGGSLDEHDDAVEHATEDEAMKIWKITATIEADDTLRACEVLRQIDRDLNRGDGLYLNTEEATLKLVKHSKDDNETE